jgi:hypothetical protein
VSAAHRKAPSRHFSVPSRHFSAIKRARYAGAELAVLAVVHKVSTLISSVDLYVADLATGKYIAHANAQFRGDDDRAYVRAFEFLVNERLNRK